MTDSDGNSGGTGNADGMLSQATVNRLLAEERRKTEAKFADYDQVKKQAEAAQKAADGQKSDIDKLTDSVKALTERAEKAERTAARAEVAKKHKLPDSFAAKLTGQSADDLDREAAEMVAELKKLGVKFDGDGGGNADDNTGGQGDNTNTGGGAGTTGGAGNGQTGTSGGAGASGGRPREDLRPGTSGTGGAATEDPRKVADDIMSSTMF